ncbi:Vacuolar protein sorting-associated protein 53 [Modicella reniformis]|uniref:Vacuolar protein sorting-associated protein 53 n=1 Tax=Modicella reniformis TaxID=1440133 RepID=A0A9P6IR58_9FUNG|nr:Vacuolar protein sorting-associated protein 53 [Modicella reniformis]
MAAASASSTLLLTRNPTPGGSGIMTLQESAYVTTTETIQLAPELNSSITHILRSKDPLDAQEFNSVEYINKIFPNEHSLTAVDQVLTKLQTKAQQVQEELRELTRAQTDGGQKSQEEVEAAKKGIEVTMLLITSTERVNKPLLSYISTVYLNIKMLFFKIKEIKEKATQSEQMVQEITQDIKSLDYAKRHLTTSITTLKRLQMLVTALDQLKAMAQRKQYRETAQLLEAVLQLIQYFRTFQNVRQIAELTESVARLQTELERDIVKDFEQGFTQDGILVGNISQLASACLVIDILGDDVRQSLVDWYCQLQLRAYRSIFKPNEEVSALDNTSRRYAWLKRLLKIHDEEHAHIFPSAWDVSHVLCVQFCQITRADLADILVKTSSTIEVPLLLQVLQLTLDFEAQLENRFLNRDVEFALNGEVESAGFTESISPCFEPYLSLYIEAEDKALGEKINGFKLQEPVPEDDPSVTVFASSTDIFLSYKSALTNCAKLSRKKPFLDLCILFGKWLRFYANDVLLNRLPKQGERRPINREYLRSICIVLNTADYSLTTTNQAKERLWANIDPEFVEQVSMESERQAFLYIINSCTMALVRAVESHYDPAMQAMFKLPWATIENVGDQSEYVSMIQGTLKTCVGTIQELITNKRYFRTFCDKFIESFVSRFAINLTRCKPISEIGAEQMLLDTQAVKSLLLEIPNLGLETSVPVPTSFVKFVNRGLSKVETVLKTAMSPHDPVEMFIDHYFLLIGDRNLPNFQKILELKGLKRAEQQQMVDLFQKKQVNMENLQENSAVMSLLQGMPAHVSSQGVVGPSAGLAGNMAGIVLGGAGGLITPGGSGTSSTRDSNPYQLGNIVTSSILSHSPFASLAGNGGAGAHGGDPATGTGGLFGLGQDKESGAGSSAGVGGATSQGGQGQQGGSFAAGAKLNVNFRKLVAGMRAKKDQDPGSSGNPGN